MKSKIKRRSRFGTWLNRLFFPNKELGFLEEEQLQSPTRIVIRNFFSKRLARISLVILAIMMLIAFVGPVFLPIDLSYSDNTQLNVPPTMSMMSVPAAMKGKVADISAGTTYGVGVDTDGKVYVWGYTKINESTDLGNIPQEVRDAHIVQVSAGYDHIAALDDQGKVYVWGNERLGQAVLPLEISEANRKDKNLGFKQIEASYQFTAALTEDGTLYMWGNGSMADVKVRSQQQGQIEKVALTSYNYISLLKDGTVAYTGFGKPNIANIPESLQDPSNPVVDIAATSACCAAVKQDGSIVVWGTCKYGEDLVPEMESKPVELYGGRYHFTALLENGDVISWGDNTHKQSTVPASVNSGDDIQTVFAGYYQNYAVTKDGGVRTWGLKGYLFGTDELGRDMLTRVVNGGKVTMTVGVVAVIIQTFIGILLGGLAGYFGGAVDMIIMRVAEVIGGLPFLPFMMILSAVIGARLTTQQKMYMVMIILGLLSWTGLCRLVRAQIFAQREMEYVVAAKTMGVKESKIIFRHIIPNVMSVTLVTITLSFGTAMLTESSLSYLGFGIPLPTPTWGNLLTGANNSIVVKQYWWRWVFPAAIFALTTISINLIGDAIRDAIDPKSSER